MAHSIEGRVPFLDLEMIRLGQLIPTELKLNGSPPVEKWILRSAFSDMLPEEIVWRDKEQFDEGSGTVDVLGELIEESMTDREAADYMERHPRASLRSKEECCYHRLFYDVFDNPRIIEANVARWAERPRFPGACERSAGPV
jgi:asparagine synthase (glutamine-hydrolysing)